MTDEEKLEYRKRELSGYAEFIAIPEDQREAYVVSVVNDGLMKAGLAPIKRLLTDEEIEVARQKLYGSAKKKSFTQRFRRAWAILWDTEA